MKPYTPSLETNDDVEKTAADWVTRCDAGLTAAEQQIFQDWLAADARHADAFDRLSEAWAVFDRVQQQGAASVILDRLEQRIRRRRSRRAQAGVAAGAVLCAGLLYFGLRAPAGPAGAEPGPTPPAPRVAFDPIRKLPDGSIVELKEGAEIEVAYSAEARRVRMVRGEAYFRVEKDKARPFYVEAHGVQVRAVGTAFSVQMQAAAVEVVVKEGAVDVGHATPATNDSGPVRVDAGNRIVMPLMRLRPAQRASIPTPAADPTAHSEPVQPVTMTEQEMEARLAWRLPRLEFEGMPLAEAVALLNRHNALQISLADPAVGALRISGNFRADNPEGFVSVAEQSLELVAVRISERQVVLRRQR